MWPFKWNLLSSTFMWYCLLCCTRFLTFKSVDKTLVCDHSNESYWAVCSCDIMKKIAVVHCGKVLSFVSQCSHFGCMLWHFDCLQLVFIRRRGWLVMQNLITYHLCLCDFRRQRELDKQNLKQFFDERQRVSQVWFLSPFNLLARCKTYRCGWYILFFNSCQTGKRGNWKNLKISTKRRRRI